MKGTSMREVRVGALVLAAIAALFAFVGMAGGGPGFLASRRGIDVIFRDGQGLRVGSPVRVAGIDAGRVTGLELVPVDGTLRARVRLSVPNDLAARLKADLKITIQASLTGQSLINIVDSGRSEQPLVPGQVVAGVETTFFDPVLEQVGLGPVERSHLSHTIAEVRQTVDAAGPRLRTILAELQQTSSELRQTAETARPAVAMTVGRIGELTEKIDTAQFDATLKRITNLVGHTEAILNENRPVIQATLAQVNGLTGDLRGVVQRDVPKVVATVDGFNQTRGKVDQVLAQANVVVTQGAEMLTVNHANIDRTVANVRDATDYGNKLVQKLYGNPFYLSPFYKPTKEDIAAQDVYDAANSFMLGAKELKDTITAIQALRTAKSMDQMTESEQKAYQALINRAWQLETQMQQTSQTLAAGLRNSSRR
jgi:phospholipid/cholesterol/gamma-HCH transport system substrate-binding protein